MHDTARRAGAGNDSFVDMTGLRWTDTDLKALILDVLI